MYEMMKTFLLLVCAVCVSSSTVRDRRERTALLQGLVSELESVLKVPLMQTKGKDAFLAVLTSGGCKHEYFCQAKNELVQKVSGLSGDFFKHFRTDMEMMRNLDQFNKLYGVKTCKAVDKNQTEVTLDAFLETLLSCVKHVNGQKF